MFMSWDFTHHFIMSPMLSTCWLHINIAAYLFLMSSVLEPFAMAGWKYILLLAVVRTEAIVRTSSLSRYPREEQSYGIPSSETTQTPPSGPYPPSGWAPSGSLLLLAGETHSSQQNGQYGPPPPPPPPNTYGPSATTESATTTTEPNSDVDGSDDGDGTNNENGQYYVLLGNGKLQKVQYTGKQRERGQYEAHVQYEEVDPIKSPVYSVQPISSFQFP